MKVFTKHDKKRQSTLVFYHYDGMKKEDMICKKREREKMK